MLRGELAVEDIEQFLFARLQSFARITEHLLRTLPGDQSLDHRPCRLTMDVADHHRQANARIAQGLVQPVLLGGEHPSELLHLARGQTQLTKVGRREKTTAQQTAARQKV